MRITEIKPEPRRNVPIARPLKGLWTGFFFRNHWRAMVRGNGEVELDAVFGTIEEAQLFLGIHNSQITQTEKVIWERR